MVEKDPEFGPGVVFLEPVGHVAYDTYVASLLKNRDFLASLPSCLELCMRQCVTGDR